MRRDPSAVLGVLAATLLAGALSTTVIPAAGVDRRSPEPTGEAVTAPPWLQVGYGALIDRRRLTHSGESIGTVLARLGGRPFPRGAERPADAAGHVLLDPLLEPYAFVLPDTIDSIGPMPDPPMIELGALWRDGQAQPAWAGLLRSRRLLVESDGEGRMRLFLPWTPRDEGGDTAAVVRDGSMMPEIDPVAAGEQAWLAARPVLRHVVAAERRRLATKTGGAPPAIALRVHAAVHYPARSLFHLAAKPYELTVEQLGPGRAPLDLAAWQSFLDRGLLLEGARLDPGGRVRLLGSEPSAAPSLLGRPLSLADFAVAYRAVFHGGLSEPYMSLDRGLSPQTSLVNYGGRLQDTSLGMVSLLCDARFKTFSLGLDIFDGADVRAGVRETLSTFRTHLERFAADPRSKEVRAQQTRLWFYPDNIDLTLSPEGDVVVMRRSRMSAASERLLDEAGRRPEDPPWTRETVAAINRDYDALSRFFPELSDLDQVARLLSFFTWLRLAGGAGLELPDLDALLALELPALPTPRTFPQLLTFNGLPAAGGAGPVDVIDRSPVVDALERMEPWSPRPLPPRRRLLRARDALNPAVAAHAAFLERSDPAATRGLDDSALDLLTYEAERLFMHHLSGFALSEEGRRRLTDRRRREPQSQTLSVGIGGLDLGMTQAFARATPRSRTITWGGSAASAATPAASAPGAAAETRPPASAAAVAASASPRVDPPALPSVTTPDHGIGSGARREFSGGWAGRATVEAGAGVRPLLFSVLGADGVDPRSRLVVFDGAGRVSGFERVEEMRFLRYRIRREGAGAVAQLADDDAPSPARRLGGGADLDRAALPETAPAGLLTMHVEGAGGEVAATASADPGVALHLRGLAGGETKDLNATVPRPLVRRIVLGPETDLAPGTPLRGFSPLPPAFGTVRSLMVFMNPAETSPPWHDAAPVLPAEEDALRLVQGLSLWWAADGPTAVVGTDPAASPRRWAEAPKPDAGALLLLPDDAFPRADRRARLARAWSGGTVAPVLPAAPPSLVVLASAEAPGPFAVRLRELARSPAMKGKALAAMPLGGPTRPDLAASLLAEGNLAALGVSAWSPLSAGRAESDLAVLRKALSDKVFRPDELPGFLWFY